jgi:hypothetical protein
MSVCLSKQTQPARLMPSLTSHERGTHAAAVIHESKFPNGGKNTLDMCIAKAKVYTQSTSP